MLAMSSRSWSYLPKCFAKSLRTLRLGGVRSAVLQPACCEGNDWRPGVVVDALLMQVERNNVQSALRCMDCYEQGFIFLDLADPTGWQILYVSPQAALQTGTCSQSCLSQS